MVSDQPRTAAGAFVAQMGDVPPRTAAGKGGTTMLDQPEVLQAQPSSFTWGPGSEHTL